MNKRELLKLMGGVAITASAAGCQSIAGVKQGVFETPEIPEGMKPFPAELPKHKPAGRPLSAAMQRMYDQWEPHGDMVNPFATSFKYSKLTGLGPEDGISRRDPSTIIKKDGVYYIWFTRRDSPPVIKYEHPTETNPGSDWDMADIGYATSTDGFNWVDRGVAVPRPKEADKVGSRTLSTPDVLVWKGKYYLYYQTASQPRIPRGDVMNMSMAYADSPEGPWTRTDKTLLSRGAVEDWDSSAIHDPFPIVFKGKIYLYYKAAPLRWDPVTGETIHRSGPKFNMAQGVAIADDPFGPFVKSPMNPVLNSGHETLFYRYEDGVATIISRDGPEKNTVQFSRDGINFEIKTGVQLPPIAGGPFDPDAFSNTDDAKGVAWGVSHIKARTSYIIRWDCNLRKGERDERFYQRTYNYNGESHFANSWSVLPKDIKEDRLNDLQRFDPETKF